jgi:protein phosphatase
MPKPVTYLRRDVLVMLIGVSGSGKSTFAKQHFGCFETVSSDVCQGLVSDDKTSQSAPITP